MHEYELQNQQALCECLPLFPSLQPCSTSPRKPKMLHRLQALPRKLKKRWKIPPCLPAGHLLRRWDEGGEENGGKRSISPCWTPLIRHNNETSTFLDDRCEPCLGSSFFCAFMSYSFIHPLFVKIFQFWGMQKNRELFWKTSTLPHSSLHSGRTPTTSAAPPSLFGFNFELPEHKSKQGPIWDPCGVASENSWLIRILIMTYWDPNITG